MRARALMIQGTGSNVGKSVIVAGLCRLARRRGIRVAPFKPQNMSNNAGVCPDGGEIGRAQALQARAAGVELHRDFNPVLLKPQSDRRSQVVVQGRVVGTLDAVGYHAARGRIRASVLESFERLAAAYDLVLVEGAGSPAEVNLRPDDIANMGFARATGIPVCLVGDIDRGGVIASLVGTRAVLDPEDAALIVGFAVNKFRGDPALFADGLAIIERRTGWPCFGLIHWLPAAGRLPAEDTASVSRECERGVADNRRPRERQRSVSGSGSRRIVAPMLSRLANFDDADPLRLDPGVDFAFVPPGRPIPRDTDVVVLFGTKSTVGELAFLRAQGWDHDVIAHARTGGRVLGLCGGFQMLGRRVLDPAGVDGRPAPPTDSACSTSRRRPRDAAPRHLQRRRARRERPGGGHLPPRPARQRRLAPGVACPRRRRERRVLELRCDGGRRAGRHRDRPRQETRHGCAVRGGAHSHPVTAGAPNHRSAEEAPGRASNCRSVSMRWLSASMRSPSSAREASMR